MKYFRKNSVFRAAQVPQKSLFQCSENFQGKRKLFKILKDKKYIQYSEFRTYSVFQGKQKLLKHPECKKYIKYSEKIHDKLCFQGKRKFLRNPER